MSRLSYSFQQVRDPNSNSALPNSPRHLAKFNFSAPLMKEKVFAGMDVFFMGERKTLAGRFTGSNSLVNLVLTSQKLFKGFDVSAGVYNVLGTRYADPASVEHRQDVLWQDGRSVRVRISYRLNFAR
jgi:outer membrane receptor for ferrienterochelin and colicins